MKNLLTRQMFYNDTAIRVLEGRETKPAGEKEIRVKPSPHWDTRRLHADICIQSAERIRTTDTFMRNIIHIHVCYLLSNNLSLQYTFKTTKQLTSRIIPEVCDSIITA